MTRRDRHESRGPRDREPGPEGEATMPPEAGAEAPPPKASEPAATAPADEAAAFKDRWLRAEAELQNFRRRASREWDEARRDAEERVMLEIIGALDDLDRALESAEQASAASSWTEGVRLTARRLREYLARQGVEAIDPLGQPFDPAFHEAMLEIDAPEGRAAGEVVQVVLKGYARGGRPLRAARVVVARAPAGREA